MYVHPIRLDSFYSIGIMLVGLSCSTADMVYHATTWYPGWSLEETIPHGLVCACVFIFEAHEKTPYCYRRTARTFTANLCDQTYDEHEKIILPE